MKEFLNAIRLYWHDLFAKEERTIDDPLLGSDNTLRFSCERCGELSDACEDCD